MPEGKAAFWPALVVGCEESGTTDTSYKIYDSFIIDGTKNELKNTYTRTNPTGFPRSRSVSVESVSVIAHSFFNVPDKHSTDCKRGHTLCKLTLSSELFPKPHRVIHLEL